MKFIAIAIFLVSIPLMAISEPIQIGAGKPNWGYDKASQQMVQRLQVEGIEATVVNNAGSDEIASKVCSKQVHFGIMQIDALYARQGSCRYDVLDYYGDEVAVLLTKDDSDIGNIRDLNASHAVLVDMIGSGSDLFWSTIKAIEVEHGGSDDWIKAKTVNKPITSANGLYAAGQIAAVLIVTTPTADVLRSFVEDGWKIADIQDKDINDQPFNGTSLYTRDKLDLDMKWGSSDEGSVYVVRSLVVANSDWYQALDVKQQSAIANSISASLR